MNEKQPEPQQDYRAREFSITQTMARKKRKKLFSLRLKYYLSRPFKAAVSRRLSGPHAQNRHAKIATRAGNAAATELISRSRLYATAERI